MNENTLTPQCSCHIINANVHRILMWIKSKENSSENYYILKIGEQQFISSLRTDKNGASYWRFKELTNQTEPLPNSESNPAPSESEAINKFYQRQSTTNSHSSEK